MKFLALAAFAVGCHGHSPDKIDKLFAAYPNFTSQLPWDAEVARLEAVLGPAQDSDARSMSWAVTDGEECGELVILEADEHGRKMLVGLSTPERYTKDSHDYASCVKDAKNKGPR